MRLIVDVAAELGIGPESLIPHGRHIAKLPLEARAAGPRGKLIVVTGVTPTPAGEGKTTTLLGMVDAFAKHGLRVAGTIREPALGPIFGIKGGGTGGGKARALPEEAINVHFTGDTHAVGTAHNLLVTLAENAAHRGRIAGLRPDGLTMRRVSNVEDRALRQVVTGPSAAAPTRRCAKPASTSSPRRRSWPSSPWRAVSTTCAPASAA